MLGFVLAGLSSADSQAGTCVFCRAVTYCQQETLKKNKLDKQAIRVTGTDLTTQVPSE
jgi:hypothetical protein